MGPHTARVERSTSHYDLDVSVACFGHVLEGANVKGKRKLPHSTRSANGKYRNDRDCAWGGRIGEQGKRVLCTILLLDDHACCQTGNLDITGLTTSTNRPFTHPALFNSLNNLLSDCNSIYRTCCTRCAQQWRILGVYVDNPISSRLTNKTQLESGITVTISEQIKIIELGNFFKSAIMFVMTLFWGFTSSLYCMMVLFNFDVSTHVTKSSMFLK